MKRRIQQILVRYKESDVITRASICFVLVTIIDKGITLITQPLINRILSVSEVGLYNSFSSWEQIINILASFYLFCGVLEVLITKEKDDRNQVVGSLCVLSMLITVLVFGVAFVFINPVSKLLELKPIYIVIMGLMILSGSINQFWYVPKRFEYKYKPYAIVGVSCFFIKSLLSVFFAFIFKDRVLGRMLGLCLPSLILSFGLFPYIISKTDLKRISVYWKRALLFNLPLLPHYLSSVLLASSDRIMIQRLDSSATAGLYSVAYSYSALTLVIFSAINNAYTPYAYAAIRDGKYKELSKKTNVMLLFSVMFSLCLVLLAPEGMLVLGGEEYLETVDIIPVLIVGIFFSSFYYIFANVEFVCEKTKYVFPITVLGAGINILLNWLLIPSLGYKVAAYTTLLGYVIIALSHYVVSLAILKKNIYSMKNIVCYILLLAGVSALSIPLLRFHRIIRYSFFILFLGISCFAVVKKKDYFVTKKPE